MRNTEIPRIVEFVASLTEEQFMGILDDAIHHLEEAYEAVDLAGEIYESPKVASTLWEMESLVVELKERLAVVWHQKCESDASENPVWHQKRDSDA